MRLPSKLLTDANIADGRQRLEALFNDVGETVRRGDRRGCLLCSAAAGPASEDADIAAMVHRLLSDLQNAFQDALGASNRHAGFSAQERTDLASLLMTQYVGLRILARSQVSAEMIEQSIFALLHVMND